MIQHSNELHNKETLRTNKEPSLLRKLHSLQELKKKRGKDTKHKPLPLAILDLLENKRRLNIRQAWNEELAKRVESPYDQTYIKEQRNLDLQRLELTSYELEFFSFFTAHRYRALTATLGPDGYIDTHWRTEFKILPADKLVQLWRDLDKLVGVRFGNSTRYAVIDIDTESEYHNAEGRAKIEEVLSHIGIKHTIWVQSSVSGGWHCYIFFKKAYNTFRVATLLRQTMEENGLDVADGTLEIFPNRKAYSTNVKDPSLYNGHRLPLQRGSYLLDSGKASCKAFVAEANYGIAVNELSEEALEESYQRFKQQRKYQFIVNKIFAGQMSARALAWKTEVEETIATGWTANHQTNKVGYHISIKHYVFDGIEDFDELVEAIIRTATSCPGYRQYCRHQHNIYQRAKDWTKYVKKHLRPYGTAVVVNYTPSGGPNKNVLLREAKRQDIINSIERLQFLGKNLSIKAIAREANVDPKTVKKHKDLLSQLTLESRVAGFGILLRGRKRTKSKPRRSKVQPTLTLSAVKEKSEVEVYMEQINNNQVIQNALDKLDAPAEVIKPKPQPIQKDKTFADEMFITRCENEETNAEFHGLLDWKPDAPVEPLNAFMPHLKAQCELLLKRQEQDALKFKQQYEADPAEFNAWLDWMDENKPKQPVRTRAKRLLFNYFGINLSELCPSVIHVSVNSS